MLSGDAVSGVWVEIRECVRAEHVTGCESSRRERSGRVAYLSLPCS